MAGHVPFILSIDDDPDIRDLLESTLSAAGYRVATASSGDEGLSILEAEVPDLVLLDVMMPGMSGYDVCRQLGQLPMDAVPPIVFLTALDAEKDRARAFACGAVGYLNKPFARAELLETIRHNLRTTSDWKQLVAEAESWSDRTAPANFSEFLRHLIGRKELPMSDAAGLESCPPRNLYEAAGAASYSEREVATAASSFLGITYVATIDADALVLDDLPAAFCRSNLVVPTVDAQGLPVYVVANPFDWELLSLLERRSTESDSALHLEISTPSSIRALFDSEGAHAVDSSPALSVEDIGQSMDTIEVETAPVVVIANNIVISAVRERASDIHFEPKEDRIVIRFRIDGDMHDMLSVQPQTGAMLLSRLKALGQLDITEKRRPQDGSFEMQIGESRIKLRLATSSGPHGESLVIRLLDASASPKSLPDLGFTTRQAEQLYSLAERPHGMILIVGPTGSGKTTTIYSTLSSVDTERRSLMTVEDPVEYMIPRANHQQVNDKAGVTFENLLKSSVRQDPDVLFLGEIRDQFSARTALDFSSTGHLTISTLHTANATTAIFRLERLGVERAIMADSLLAVVAQRLVKSLCPHCRVIEPISAEESARLALFTTEIPETVAHPVGCSMCRDGYQGRTGVQEVLMLDPEVASWIREGVAVQDVRQRLADRGDYLIASSVIDKVRDHVVSPEDAWRSVLVEEQARPARSSDDPPSVSITTPIETAPAWQPPVADSVGVVSHARSNGAGDFIGVGGSSPPPSLEKHMRETAKPRVLVADDDEDTRILVGRTLTSEGYEVAYASDGAEAFELLRDHEFDLVVSDATMPRMDGLDLMKALTRGGIPVPMVMLTGVEDGAAEATALALGVADYVGKPVHKDVLLIRVSRVLGGRTRGGISRV